MLVENPSALRAQYAHALWEDVIPFWLRHSPDREYGGYFTCLNRDGSVFDTDKFVWLQARQVWMFSKYYNALERRPAFLEMATLGARFLAEHGHDAQGDWYFALDRRGAPLVQPYNIFSDCFAAMAFAEYGRATGERWPTDLAVRTFERILARWDNPKGQYNKLVPGSRPLRSLALPMITINLALELSGAIPAYPVEQVVRENLALVMDRFVDRQAHRIYEHIAPDGSHPDTFDGRLINPGHGIECMWFCMIAAEQLGAHSLIERAVDALEDQIALGWDQEFGGIFYFLDAQGKPPQQLEWDQKLWWVHMEALIALLLGWRFTRRPSLAQWYDRVHAYTWAHFPDPEYGEWYGYLNRRGEVLLPLKGGKWKGCFHVPRGLWWCMRILEQIEGDSVSDMIGYSKGADAMQASIKTTNGTCPPSRRRRVIFNCDGFGVFHDARGDQARWIDNIFAPLDSRYVDALFWCDGAGGNTVYYDSQVLELTGQRLGKVPPFLKRLIAEGNDPPLVVVREARKRLLDVFYSFRINDVHDDFLPDELATFKVQHPEWLIGEGHPYGTRTALNFAVPEVRQLKLAVISELFTKYDFDGLEIDFMRGVPFFIPGDEPKHAHVLTQFLHDVREHLIRRGQERGRPIELAVRVGENLAACRLDGLDVCAWIKDGLVDIVILGSGPLDIAIEEFKALAEGTAVLIYPCLYGWPSHYTPIPAELARGLAANYWFQGADGIYTFNWFPHEANKRYQAPLLSELSDPQSLQGKPMMFAADRGRPQRDYPHNWLYAVLPFTLIAGNEITVPIMVGADLTSPAPVDLAMTVACDNLPSPAALQVQLNDLPLPEGVAHGVGREDASLTICLPTEALKRGRNQVRFGLTTGRVVVTAVEIHVSYT